MAGDIVMRCLAQDNKWWNGIITDYNGLTGEHWCVSLHLARGMHAALPCQKVLFRGPDFGPINKQLLWHLGPRDALFACNCLLMLGSGCCCSIVYDAGTSSESFEWLHVDTASPNELRVLDETVNVLDLSLPPSVQVASSGTLSIPVWAPAPVPALVARLRLPTR